MTETINEALTSISEGNVNYKNIFVISDLYDITRGQKKFTKSFDLYTPPKYLTDPQYVATSLIKDYIKN